MALSTPPQPPGPSTTGGTTDTASSTPSRTTSGLLVARPSNPYSFYSPPQSRLPSNANPNYPQSASRPPHPYPYSHLHPPDPSQFLYPIASTGRGFTPRPVSMPATCPVPRPPFVFTYVDQSVGNLGFTRPTQLQHVLLGPWPGPAPNVAAGAGAPGVIRGNPVSSSQQTKVASPASMPDIDGHKDSWDRTKDETFVIIKGRKVQICEEASLYSLCQSWLRNGFPEETQPQYLDAVRSLPKPLPVAVPVVDSPNKKEEDEPEEDEDDRSCEHLSAKDLLQRHIKHAKRVRTRLREERLHRIMRYKTRLALLLPPMVEQLKNESAAAS